MAGARAPGSRAAFGSGRSIGTRGVAGPAEVFWQES
jgi:hypothetical protein